MKSQASHFRFDFWVALLLRRQACCVQFKFAEVWRKFSWLTDAYSPWTRNCEAVIVFIVLSFQHFKRLRKPSNLIMNRVDSGIAQYDWTATATVTVTIATHELFRNLQIMHFEMKSRLEWARCYFECFSSSSSFFLFDFFMLCFAMLWNAFTRLQNNVHRDEPSVLLFFKTSQKKRNKIHAPIETGRIFVFPFAIVFWVYFWSAFGSWSKRLLITVSFSFNANQIVRGLCTSMQ